MPLHCIDCNKILKIPCDKHKVITCTNTSCSKQFHIGCLESFFNDTLEDINNEDYDYLCMECIYKDTCSSTPWNDIEDRNELFKRFGLVPKEGLSRLKRIQKVLIEDCGVPHQIISDLKNNDPQPHPSITLMSMENMEHQALCGRRFDVSMLMYSIHTCDCCGVTMPLHRDPYFPKDAPFDRKHFIKSYYKSWHCTCNGYCNGSQFYSYKRGKNLNHYRAMHDGLYPWDYLNKNEKDPNALLCKKCHSPWIFSSILGEFISTIHLWVPMTKPINRN